MEIEEILEHGLEHFLPNISVDLVIIGYKGDKLQCQLLKLEDKWALPGGYVKRAESVDDAVKRLLAERTYQKDPHLAFLSVFGDKDRNFKNAFRQYFTRNSMTWKEAYWINDRFVTLAYYTLIDTESTILDPGEIHEEVGWFDFDDLPPMWLDHRAIVDKARSRLKEDCKQIPVSYNLLSEEFTMPELHRLHQTILEEKLDRSRFQKKMLATDMFERLPKLKTDSRGSNPYKYRLKQDT